MTNRRLISIVAGACALCAVVSASPVASRPSPTSAADSHCKAGERVVYTCDLRGKRVSICRDGDTFIYRFGRAGRPEIELGRAVPPTVLDLHNQVANETQIRFANGRYSYGIYNIVAPEGVRWQSGLTVWRDGKLVSDTVCRTAGRRQNLDGHDLFDLLERERDPAYMAW